MFPQPLYYNRLTGTFLEVPGKPAPFPDYAYPITPPYGATDEERERMLEWAKDERLPLFLRLFTCTCVLPCQFANCYKWAVD